jgi:hypothetical protein
VKISCDIVHGLEYDAAKAEADHRMLKRGIERYTSKLRQRQQQRQQQMLEVVAPPPAADVRAEAPQVAAPGEESASGKRQRQHV